MAYQAPDIMELGTVSDLTEKYLHDYTPNGSVTVVHPGGET